MRNAKGQFVKGYRANPDTEFKPGTHWRPRKLFWDREWLYAEYVTKKRPANEIATEFGVTESAILFWLEKHSIPTRSMQEIRVQKHWGLSGKKNGMYGVRGKDNPNWKGGVTPERQAFYCFQEWASVVLQIWSRDKATCQRCSARQKHNERAMHIHHIAGFENIELRCDLDNLILLCPECHHWVHSNKNAKGQFVK